MKLSETFGIGPAPPSSKTATTAARYGLRWEDMDELDEDHGLATCVGPLDEVDLWMLTKARRAQLIDEIRAEVPEPIWALMSQEIEQDEIDKREKKHGLVGYSRPREDSALVASVSPDVTPRSLDKPQDAAVEKEESLADGQSSDLISDWRVVGIWADLFTEPLTEVWLAAMAMYALDVHRDAFSFGYLTALLDQRRSEADYLRGKKSVDSGRAGAEVRAAKLKPITTVTLRAMEELIRKGHTISNAAELVARAGKGTSKEANIQLWKRRPKKGT